jgi:hypothetical protein
MTPPDPSIPPSHHDPAARVRQLAMELPSAHFDRRHRGVKSGGMMKLSSMARDTYTSPRHYASLPSHDTLRHDACD